MKGEFIILQAYISTNDSRKQDTTFGLIPSYLLDKTLKRF